MTFWKDKTIIAYIALAHHTRFITPVMDTLQKRGAKIKYVVGQAERSQEITAIELGLPYTHIYSYLSEKDRGDIRAAYEGMRISFAPRLKYSFLLGVQPVTVTDKTLLSTAMEYIGFQRLMEKEKPDLCFALHELNRWGKMFAFWAKKSQVPFITLHEGLTYGMDFAYTGFAQYASLNLVWGERIKKKFAGYEAPGVKLIPTGNTHLSQEIARQSQKNIRKLKRTEYRLTGHTVALVIFSAALPSPSIISPLLKAAAKMKHVKLFIKLHPACQKVKAEEWIKKFPDDEKKNASFIHGEESTYDLISASDLVVLGQRSTTGLEAIAFDKPLIKLDFSYIPNSPYSFVDSGVATKMSSEELASALARKTDFNQLVDPEKVSAYLAHELETPRNAVETVCDIFKKAVQASREKIKPMPRACENATLDWTLILSVPDDPDVFLSQIEAISVNSRNGGTYEAVILVPPVVTEKMQTVLDSLKGEVQTVHIMQGGDPSEYLNPVLPNTKGRWVVVLEKGLAPLAGWLSHLKVGVERYGPRKLIGARVIDQRGRITSAGMVVDSNHTPVPAYHHLDINFKPALEERSFQMADHFIAVERDYLLALGGISPGAWGFRFMDLCLKAGKSQKKNRPLAYLPDLQLIFLSEPPPRENPEEAAYFFPKWTGVLWESQQALYEKDGLAPKDLDQARLTTAMKEAF